MKKKFKLALFLGYKSIVNGNKRIIVLMIFILSLAFVNLIFVASILNGVTTTQNNQIINNSVANIVIDPQEKPTRENYVTHTRELRKQIEDLPGVIATAAHYNLIATFAYDKNKDGQYKYGSWPVIGVDPEEESRVTEIPQHIIAGRYLEGVGSGDVVLGADITGGYNDADGEINSLGGAKVGENINISFGNGVNRKYTIKGISKVKFILADATAYITAREARSILQLSDDRVSQILVKIKNSGEESQYIKQIKEMAPNLEVREWSEYAGVINGSTKSFGLIVNIVSGIGLVVAATTIFILIYVNTVNKRRQIGILKAIGIEENIIILSYILQSLFYAIFGIIFGSIIMFFAIEPYFISHPIFLQIGDVSLTIKKIQVLQSILSLLGAALIAGFFPAWRAVRENILKAIWGT